MKEIITFLFVILIHEAGHIVAAFLCGAKIRRLRAVFGGLRLDFDNGCGYLGELLIYSGGIIFNLLSLFLPFDSELFRAYTVGAVVYNLLPFSWSDGGGILYLLTLGITDSPYFSSKLQNIAEDVSISFLWLLAVFLNLSGKGSLPLLFSVVILIIMRVKKRKNE